MKRVYLLLIISILILSCSDDVLDRTIFIPDEENNNLPAYTEWGYNTFGAKFERDYFLAHQKITPCKVVYKDGEIHFLLNGTIRDNKEMGLLFIFPTTPINNYEDLLKLHDFQIDLSNNDCVVKMIQDNIETKLDIKEGLLHFKRAQFLSIDESPNRTILSGIFELRYFQNEFPITISSGRFDLGINESCFYSY